MSNLIILQVTEDEAQKILALLDGLNQIVPKIWAREMARNLHAQIEEQRTSKFFQCAACIERVDWQMQIGEPVIISQNGDEYVAILVWVNDDDTVRVRSEFTGKTYDGINLSNVRLGGD